MDLSRDGWSIAQKYVSSLDKVKPARSLSELRSIIGTFNWQRRFIGGYTELVQPLFKLLKQKKGSVKDNWNEDHDKALKNLKLAMTLSPVLRHPDYSKPFELYCDASNYGIGGVLVQEVEGHKHPIGCFSRMLRQAEVHYSVPVKEALGLVEATEHFRPFVYGYDLTIFTDQLSLIWLMEHCHPSRFTRYRERIAPFNAKIKYIQGKKNPADFFSRECAKVAIVTDKMQELFRARILEGRDGGKGRFVSRM